MGYLLYLFILYLYIKKKKSSIFEKIKIKIIDKYRDEAVLSDSLGAALCGKEEQ